ncbi:MAG: hypothetical protein ACH349_03195 [Candidatus Rhabdochlamydia sp.]|jgi:hypothetical protein|nr:hypothetical protein [Chlamydiota bacterium]
MAIYDISEVTKVESIDESSSDKEFFKNPEESVVKSLKQKDCILSAVLARLFFVLLFLGDCLWIIYALLLFIVSGVGILLSLGKVKGFSKLNATARLTIKRAMVCGISLFIALFNPAFGIMIACTYFLMYDKSGIEEVIPSSLRSQFSDFFQKNK